MPNALQESNATAKRSKDNEKSVDLVNVEVKLDDGVIDKFAEAMRGRNMTLSELFSCTAMQVASNLEAADALLG